MTAQPATGAIAVAGKAFAFDAVCDDTMGQARPARGAPACRKGRAVQSKLGRAALRAAAPHRRRQARRAAALTPLRAPQAHVFELAGRSTVDALLDGYSGCIIAYGQARPSRAAPRRPRAQQQQPRAAAAAR